MASAVDLSYLSAAYSVPRETFQSILDQPTRELTETLLQQLAVVARQNETTQAEKLKSDIQLESAIRNGETRAKQLRASAEKSLKDAQELREKLNDSEHVRATLEHKLQDLQTSTHTSSSDVESLQSRIASLESSNRDTVALLDRKSSTNDKLAEELTTQQQKIVALRREVSALEDKLSKAENASLSTKFREQSLQQEVALLKKNNEWHEDELKKRSTDHTRIRKEKAAQIAELQRANEDAGSSIETLRRSETSLKNRIVEVTQKLEDSFRKVQVLQEEASKSQEAFRVELDNARRLAELQKQSATTSRGRLQEVQQDLDRLRDDAAVEIGQLQAEVESERAEKEALETKVQDAEAQLEHLESELAEARRNVSRPSTPRRVNGNPSGRDSPGLFSSPGVSRLKGSLNMTQLYSEHSSMRSDLDAERRRNEKLRATLDDMIRDLEKKQPEMEEQRQEYERIQTDLNEMTALLEATIEERNNNHKEARALQGDVNGLNQENAILRQQLRDLSMQIKILLAEAQYRLSGFESLSTVDKALYEQVLAGEVQSTDLEDMSATGRLISQRLVVFRDVSELQEQNLRLGHLTRKLGEEMEGEEAQAKRQQQEQNEKDLEETRERMVRYQDEIKSLTVRSESYIRERDMYRRMLSHRGQLPADADLPTMFGQSVNAAGDVLAASAQSPSKPHQSNASEINKDLADYNRLLKEMQQQYDSYRQEASAEYSTLKEQLNVTTKHKSELQSELAKLNGQLGLSHERYDLLQSNVTMLKNENGELQKRSSSLAEVAARQDLRTQQVAEELIEARSFTEGLRNENANLKAERELWKKIEQRIGEDNQQLLEERSRLNKVLADLQSLQNERELTDAEARRRLQGRVDSLESELQTTKRKLEEEADENKKATMRREYEQEQSRTRVEDLLKALANAKEELAGAKSARDQLQARVNELSVELRAAHEKEAALQPLLTSGPGSRSNGQNDQENRLSAQQELTIQVADLKRDLELAKNELQQASSHVEQYKNISQAAEDELQTLTETHDEFKAEMDRIVLERDGKIHELESRVDELTAELASSSLELNELRDQQGASASTYLDQIAALEADIGRLRDDSERFAQTARLHQEDLKAQAEIAQRAQQAYEDELVKHADAAKHLQSIRSEYNTVKLEVTEFKAEAEASKVSLANSEDLWADTKSRYEAELAEIRTRREDVISQNRRLHDQLESVTKQIDQLKRARPTSAGADAQPATSFNISANRDEIITWLKKDKEIIEVQYELSKQEVTRYKQKLDYTEAQLDEAREKLALERQSQSDRDQMAVSHGKLMESINQLNLFRESNASLRTEARQAQSQLAERSKEVETLSQQIQPLSARVREVENELENKDGEIKLLQDDRDRLQKRIQDIFSKHQRIDPAELDALKARIAELESERDTLAAEKQQLDAKVGEIDQLVTAAKTTVEEQWQERRNKLVESAKAKAREQNGIIKEKTAQIEQLQAQKNQVDTELSEAKAEVARLTTLATANSAEENAKDSEEGEVAEGGANNDASEGAERLAAAEANAQAAEERYATSQRDSEALNEVIKALETQVTDLQKQLDAAQQEVQALQQGSSDSSLRDTDIDQLRAELEVTKRDLESARAASHLGIATGPEDGGANGDTTAEQITQRTAHLEAEFAAKEKTLQDQFDARAQKMRVQLNTKLKEGRERNEAVLQELKMAHAAEMEQLQTTNSSSATIAPKEEPVDNSEAASTPTANAAVVGADMTEEQVKKFVASNPTILEMVKRNVQNKIKAAQEQMQAQFSKRVEESKATFEQERKEAEEKGRMLEGKKFNVKFSMQERKTSTIQAQVDVVAAAAKDTPQRPVGEVWTIAKAAKPIVATTAAPAVANSLQPGKAATADAQNANPATAPASSTAATAPVSQVPNPFGTAVAAAKDAPAANPFGAATTTTNAPATSAPKRAPSIAGASGIPQSLPAKPPQGRGQPPRQASGSGIPRPGSAMGQNASQPPAGRGSAIPRGGSNRGRGNLRGGLGGARGGLQQSSAATTTSAAPASPSSLNPSAAQFAPGSNAGGPGTKRPHDGGGGNAEKRPKA